MQRSTSRFTRFLVVLAMLTSVVAVPTAANAGQGFFDDDESVFEADIEAISNAGITFGCNPPDDTFFCVDDPVTRGQMAAFMVRALGLTDRGAVDFVDDDGSIFEADIEKLAAAGITRGCNPPANAKYCPDGPVTRGQLAAFLVRAMGYDATAGGNSFTDDDGSIFEADIEKLAFAGVTKGCNPPANTKFCPADNVTRGQMAAFLTRAFDLPKTPGSGFAPETGDLALVARYHVLDHENGNEIDVDDMKYWPRGFAKGLDIEPDDSVDVVDSTGRYTGWDVLSPSTRWKYKNLVEKDDWFHFELNRAAVVGVVWRDELPLPSWLSGWAEGGTVSIDGDLVPVYEQAFPAGEVVLGSVEYTGEWREMYLVLLAEGDGTPSPEPPAPDGFSAAEPNRPCPSWVHALHSTAGPDGETYGTWHPQIDPVYWCWFGHEHGSNPDLIPGSPKVPYGYVADKLGQDEPNVGFKEFIFQDMTNEHWVRFVVHAATASHRRVCARFHTLHVEVYDLDGVQQFAAGFKADYGFAEATSDGGDGPLMPTNCGYSMPALAAQLDAMLSPAPSRSINVGAESNNYERWDARAETDATFNLGMAEFDHEFDIRDPMSHCPSMTCDGVVVRNPDRDNATKRTLSMASWRADFVFDADHALGSGEYYTDPYGSAARSSGASDAVRQYVAPGFELEFAKNSTANRIECVAFDPWTYRYTCYQIGGVGNIEDLPSPNDMAIERSLWRN